MKRFSIALVALAALALASIAFADPGSGNRLYCFQGIDDGFNGTCELTKEGAVIDTTDGDTNPNNNYAGVYVGNSKLEGRLLSEVQKLSFSYTGGPVVGGSPRFSIPIDEDGDGTTEAYAFVDAVGCSDGLGTVDAINDVTCTVSYGSGTYANWTAFVAANPEYRIAEDAVTFIIVDQPGDFTITNVELRQKPGK